MSNFFDELNSLHLADLFDNSRLINKLIENNISTPLILYNKGMLYKTFGKKVFPDFSLDEIDLILAGYTKLQKRSVVVKTDILSEIRSKNLRKTSSQIKPRFGIKAKTDMDIDYSVINGRKYFNGGIDLSETILKTEKELKERLKKVRLIGELNLTEDFVNVLGETLKSVLLHPLYIVTDMLPNTILTFLVGMTIFHYDQEGIWPAIRLKLGKEVNFGPVFEKLIKTSGFPIFPTLQEKALRYVTPMILHCGIPKYSLPGFFNRVVLPSIRQPKFVNLRGESLIEELMDSENVKNRSNKPVQYFLKYGGQTAIDGLGRSAEMVDSWLKNKKIYSSSEIGLPPHIVDYFYNWAKNNPELNLESKSGYKPKINAPTFCFDPWEIGLFIKLPEQKVRAFDAEDVYWEIKYGTEESQKISPRIRSKGTSLFSRSKTISIDKVCDKYSVTFVAGKSKSTWSFFGPSDNAPYMIFDPEYDPAKKIRRFKDREVWIVRNKDFLLGANDGADLVIEEFPSLFGEFGSFVAESWDLERKTQIDVNNFGSITSLVVPSTDFTPQPEIMGGELVEHIRNYRDDPIYIGKAPLLFLPIFVFKEQIETWEISIKSLNNSTEVNVSALKYLEIDETAIVSKNDIGVFLNLNKSDFLGEFPFGNFKIHVKGPLGMDGDFRLSVFSGLSTANFSDLYYPDGSYNSPKLEANFLVANNEFVDNYNDQFEEIYIVGKGNYLCEFLPGKNKIQIKYLHQYHENQILEQILTVFVRRVQWQLVSSELADEPWTDIPIQIPMQGLENEKSPFLLFDYPSDVDSPPNIVLHTLNEKNIPILEGRVIKTPKSRKVAKRFWQISLSYLGDLMRHGSSPVIKLKLTIDDKSRGVSQNPIPLLTITKSLQVEFTESDVNLSNGVYNIDLNWRENFHFTNRAVYFKPLHRPWDTPHKELIPDSAVSTYQLVISKDELIGDGFMMAFDIDDPWVSNVDYERIFPNIDGGQQLYILKLMDHRERRSLIEENLQVFNSMDGRLELYLMLLSNGEKNITHLVWCINNLEEASSDQIRIIFDEMQKPSNEECLSIFTGKLKSPIFLEKVISLYKQKGFSGNELSDYFEYLPKNSVLSDMSNKFLLEAPKQTVRAAASASIFKSNEDFAIKAIANLWGRGLYSLDEALFDLYPYKEKMRSNFKRFKEIQELAEHLENYDFYSGLKEVRLGGWVESNAGWGRIDQIIDLNTEESTESFSEGSGIHKIKIDVFDINMESIEIAYIDTQKNTIFYPRKKPLFKCGKCDVSLTRVDSLKNHSWAVHGEFQPIPCESNTIELKNLKFNFEIK